MAQSEGGDLTRLTRYDVQQYIKLLQDRGNKATTLNPKYSAIVTYVRYLGQLHVVENIQRPEIRHSRHISPKSLPRSDRNHLFRKIERSKNLRFIVIACFIRGCGFGIGGIKSYRYTDG
jgi:integrase/recombinase XerD